MPTVPEKIPVLETKPGKPEKNSESPSSPEGKMETGLETNKTQVELPQISTPVPSPVEPLPEKDVITMQVEGILEEDLGPIYASLPEEAKPLFRKKGEEAATEISTMLKTLKINTARILRLIRDWLLTIPKVNKFFLEQEAKIKTDRIIDLHESTKNEPPTS
ncbi:MAG: hypothetical protein NUV81_02285 [bacterium]|nr:hypothetical protein [bacterium]